MALAMCSQKSTYWQHRIMLDATGILHFQSWHPVEKKITKSGATSRESLKFDDCLTFKLTCELTKRS